MKKSGFTLIELIVTLILLSIVGGIIVFNVSSNGESSKEKEYEKYLSKVESAASVYADLNMAEFNQLYETKSFIYVKVRTLVENGLLDENLKNPYTNKKIDLNSEIKVDLDENSGLLKYSFYDPSDKIVIKESNNDISEGNNSDNGTRKEDVLLSYIDISITMDELENGYYDCFKDYNTYKLTLTTASGSFMSDADKLLKNKYKLTCSVSGLDVENEKIKVKSPGEYVIKYTWVNGAGIRKSKTRKLTVKEITCTFTYYINFAELNEIFSGKLTKLIVDGTVYTSDYKKVYTIKEGGNIPELPKVEFNPEVTAKISSVNINGVIYTIDSLSDYKVHCDHGVMVPVLVGDDSECNSENEECGPSECDPKKDFCGGEPIPIEIKNITISILKNTAFSWVKASSTGWESRTVSKNGTVYYDYVIKKGEETESTTIKLKNSNTTYYRFTGYKCTAGSEEIKHSDLALEGFENSTKNGDKITYETFKVVFKNPDNIPDKNIVCKINYKEIIVDGTVRTNCRRGKDDHITRSIALNDTTCELYTAGGEACGITSRTSSGYCGCDNFQCCHETDYTCDCPTGYYEYKWGTSDSGRTCTCRE